MRKNPGTAAVLALVFGFFGLWGIGHVYVGRIARGIGLLLLGLLLGMLVVISLFGIFSEPALGSLFLGITATASIVGWIWQTYDAYNLAKYYNQQIDQGVEPW
ncbi:hypothetical protein [Archaeoglobus sp.]